MSTKNLASFAVLILQLSTLLSIAHASDNELGKITVQVIDEVGIPENEWRVAEQFAEKVFRTAGISVTLVRCLWHPGTGNTECLQPTTPNELNLLILDKKSATRLQAAPGVFGMAVTAPEGSFGSRAYVFYGRIQTTRSEHRDVNAAFLLGAVVAHELGHLLLGPNSHSPWGIMKQDLERSNITGINLSVLGFDNDQRKTLRNAVARRLEAAHLEGMNASSFMAQATAPSDAR